MGLIDRLLACLLVFAGFVPLVLFGALLSFAIIEAYPNVDKNIVIAGVSGVIFSPIGAALIWHFIDR